LSQPAQSRLQPEEAVAQDLAAILHPLDAAAFLTNDYGQRFVHVPGPATKFSNLFPWPVLNDILEQHRLEPPRLRLTREGRPVPPEKYLAFQSNRRKSGQPIPRLNATALTGELRAGATLVLDNVDELYRPIRRLAESLERVFRVRVQVNSYSGWRTSHGFDLHWDDHDVFILQVAGRKHWQVYGVSRPYPLPRDAAPTAEPPKEIVWEGLLESGDLLYMPRGWWHVATPLDEPTLHLTVGVNNPTGADYLAWFVDRLRASDAVRQDIPHLQGRSATYTYADQLRQVFEDAWRPDLIDEYMVQLDAKARPRPTLALPWSATEELLPMGAYRVQWTGSRAVAVDVNDGHAVVAANGRRWKFAAAVAPLLELLVQGHECSEDELVRVSAGAFRSDLIRPFIKELAASGLVVVR
jgi:ribosomal protein L16 Arg81 hydroxylase